MRYAGDLRRHRAFYDVTVIMFYRSEDRSSFDTEEEYRTYIKQTYGIDIALYLREEEERRMEAGERGGEKKKKSIPIVRISLRSCLRIRDVISSKIQPISRVVSQRIS